MVTLWCSSYFLRRPLRISTVSSTEGGSTITVWKRRSSAPSFSMYLRYSLSVDAPTHCSSPRASAGFSMLEASTAPSAAPAPTSVCSSSMKRMMLRFWAISLITALSRSSNWPRYFVPAITAAMSSDSTRWSRSASGHWPLAMSWASPSTIAVLPTPGSPIRTGLFFLRRDRISITRSISFWRPIVGSSAPSPASWVRSRQKWSSAGVLDFFSLLGLGVCVAVDPGVGEHLCRDALLLPQQPEQQVLGADVGVIQLAGFAHRELEHLLGARRIGQTVTGGRGRFPLLDGLFDLLLDLFEVDVEVGQNGRRHPLALADQPEQDVLGSNVLVVQPRGFFPRHLQDFPHTIREVVPVHRRSCLRWSPRPAG